MSVRVSIRVTISIGMTISISICMSIPIGVSIPISMSISIGETIGMLCGCQLCFSPFMFSPKFPVEYPSCKWFKETQSECVAQNGHDSNH